MNNELGRTLPGALLCALVAWAPSAQAQEGAIEEVVVTGSYIRGTPEDAASPVDVTTREDLDITGNPSILEMLRSMGPVAGIDGETNQFQSNGLEAISNVNLRGLGAGRTLVLLNGARVVPSPFYIGQDGQQFVNTNAIPTIALERVELLKDGASATYGSDAVAGVVNFITRSDFRGIEFQGAYKDIEDAEDPDYEAGLIVGFGNDQLDVVISGAYQFRGELMVREKDWALPTFAENSTPGGYTSIGNPGTYVPLVPLLSGGGAQFTPDPDCETVGNTNAGGFCRFQYSQFDNVAEEEEHYQVFVEATYQLSDRTELHGEFLYAHDEAPEWNTSPSYPPQALLDGDQIVVPGMPHFDDFLARNPQLDPADWGAGALVWGRTLGVAGPAEVGPRKYDLYRVSGGLTTEFSDGILMDATVTYGWTEGERFTDDTRTDHLAFAYRGMGGANCDRDAFYADPAGSGVVPGSGNLGTGDCFYYNPFTSAFTASQAVGFEGVPGPGSENASLNNNLDMLEWLTEPLGSEPETKLLVLDLVFSGESGISAAGGSVGWAAGLQYRRDDYETNLADNSNLSIEPCAFGIQEGENFTLPDTPIDGGVIPAWEYTCIGAGAFNFLAASDPFEDDQDVIAGFGELMVPLTDSFELQIAARYEDYGGDVGSTLDPKVAARWDLTDEVTLRGSLGSSFRAPTLNQLGGRFTALSFVNPALAFKAIDTTGNPQLSPEQAITTNLGIIWQPGNGYFSLDYWNFDFKEPIVLESFNDVVVNCFDPTSPIQENACEKIIFQDPANPTPGGISRIQVDYQNGPDIETAGIDYQASYDFEMGGSLLTLGTQGTWISKYDVDDWIWAEGFDAAGRLNANTATVRPLPELKNNAWVNWAMGGHNLRLDVFYVSEYDDDRAGVVAGVPAGTKIDDHWTVDLSYNFRFNNDNTRLFASVYNITDEDPPMVRLDLNYDPYTHNPFGRIVKVGVQHRFAGGMFQ